MKHKMQRGIRRVVTSIREHTCVSYAKIATIGGFCDIDHIIVKATSHNDFPSPDKYVNELLKIFSLSASSCSTFAIAFARRFHKTNSWRVALKCLLLLHRLLRALPNDSPLRAELLWTRTNKVLCLYPCNFQDCSSSDSDDYTSFIRSYARLLDEALDYVSNEDQHTPGLDINSPASEHQMHCDDEQENNPILQIKDFEAMIATLPHLQSLIDRAIDCWPSGAASRSFLVHSAMKHIIRDSFSCYETFRREIVMVLDNLVQLPYRSCVAAFGIYKKAALQGDHLSGYHVWCKSMGYCGSYEYPFIDQIPDIHIRALETFLSGMWELTDHSSSSSNEQSPLSEADKRAKEETELEKRDMEMEPLIKWEVENNNTSVGLGWEDLLEASISANSCMDSRNDRENGWQMQVYNPTPNPFYNQQQIHRTNHYPWGL